jgi:hypothetical protein
VFVLEAKTLSSMKTYVRMRTAPSLLFDDVKSQKAGSTKGVRPFLEATPVLAGPEQRAASAAIPVRPEL